MQKNRIKCWQHGAALRWQLSAPPFTMPSNSVLSTSIRRSTLLDYPPAFQSCSSLLVWEGIKPNLHPTCTYRHWYKILVKITVAGVVLLQIITVPKWIDWTEIPFRNGKNAFIWFVTGMLRMPPSFKVVCFGLWPPAFRKNSHSWQ